MTLQYSYRVSVPDGMHLTGVQLVVPEAKEVNHTSSFTTIDGRTHSAPACVSGSICATGHVPLSGQFVDVEASAFFSVRPIICSLAPPDGGCFVNLHDTLIETRFTASATTAIPEPSTIVLLSTGLMAWVWRERYKKAGTAHDTLSRHEAWKAATNSSPQHPKSKALNH